MAKTLKSNEFWGKRSGSVTKTEGGREERAFKQKKYANGRENRGTPDRCNLINVPHRWFKGNR